jgi:hypothetical protein
MILKCKMSFDVFVDKKSILSFMISAKCIGWVAWLAIIVISSVVYFEETLVPIVTPISNFTLLPKCPEPITPACPEPLMELLPPKQPAYDPSLPPTPPTPEPAPSLPPSPPTNTTKPKRPPTLIVYAYSEVTGLAVQNMKFFLEYLSFYFPHPFLVFYHNTII